MRVLQQVARHYQQRANNDMYRTDPVAWAREELGVTLWSKQQEILWALANHKNVAVKTTFSVGKNLPLDTPLPTPEGWTTMGEVRVGDQVLDHEGKPTTVTYVSPTMRTKMYRLTFNDGTTIDAGADHQWNTLTLRDRQRTRRWRRKGPDWRDCWDESSTKTTQEIVDTLRNSSGQAEHLIPVARPLQLPDAELPLDPYVLGAWLGDGSSRSAYMWIGNGDGQHIKDEFEARGFPLEQSENDPIRYAIQPAQRGNFSGIIRAMGVYRNKHIPEMYLRASQEQRLELLRGLMDTDGFVVRNGSVGIDLANKALAHGLAELVRTMGVKVNVREGTMTISGRKVTGTRYRLAFTPTFNPFTEGSPKWEAFGNERSDTSITRTTCRTIVDAVEIPTVDSRCISVDNDMSLYLAGENFIPTHNTFNAALATAWWISTRGPEAGVLTTAPTNRQVRALLWAEVQRFHVRAGLPGRITQDARWMYPYGNTERMVAEGVKPADAGPNEEIHTMQGLHRPGGVLAIGDEACGLSAGMFRGLQRITTGDHDKILLIGNPTDPNTEFARLFKEKPKDWYLITISAFDTPRFTGEHAPPEVIRGMPSPEWVEMRRQEWGEDSNLWQTNILAEFPESASDGLFNMTNVAAAMSNDEITRSETAAPVMGVDVARFGGDQNVIYVRYGDFVEKLDEWGGLDTVETAQRIANHAMKIGCKNLRVDAIGVGAGVVDNLVRLLPDAAIYEMVGNAASPNSLKWYNARAYWYDTLRERINSGELRVPDSERLTEEFRAIRYEFRNTAMLIESKDEMRKRGVTSPDNLDALVYACAKIDNVGIEEDRIITEDDILSEYDFDLYDGIQEPWMIAPW